MEEKGCYSCTEVGRDLLLRVRDGENKCENATSPENLNTGDYVVIPFTSVQKQYILEFAMNYFLRLTIYI